MNSSITKYSLLTLLFSITCFFARGQEECELRKSEHGISVYACKVTDSKLKSIKAEFIVPARPSVLVGHMLNVDQYIQWQYRMIEAAPLKRVSDREVIYRSEVQAPWPVSNRDLIVNFSVKQDPNTKVMTFTLKGIPEYVPHKKGVVRIPRSEGKWVVTPIGKDKVKVEYSLKVDPGGSIPAWLLNLSIAEGPYESFRNLIDRINKGTPVTPASFIID